MRNYWEIHLRNWTLSVGANPCGRPDMRIKIETSHCGVSLLFYIALHCDVPVDESPIMPLVV